MPQRARHLSILAAAFIPFGAPVALADRPDAAARAAQAVESKLDSAGRDGFVGVVLLRHGGRTLLRKAWGPGSCDGKVPATPMHAFDIGSITKVFTGAAVLHAAEHGLLALEATLGELFPDVPPDKRDITVMQILRHESGLLDSLGEDETLIRRDLFLDLTLQTPLVRAPGTGRNYSNVGFSLLAATLERLAAPLSFEDYLRRHVLLPAGTRGIGYVRPNWPADELACGFVGERAWGSTRDYFGPYAPSWHLTGNGGLLADVDELDRWFEALIGGRLLSESSTKLVVEALASRDGAGERVIAITGSNRIFSSVYRRWLERGLVLVVFTSRAEYPKERVLPLIDEALAPWMRTRAKREGRDR